MNISKSLKLIVIFIVSFIIANLISFYMGAFPATYKVIPYSASEQLTLRELNKQLLYSVNDVDILTALGAQYFLHNELTKAKKIFKLALKFSPQNAETLSWFSANQAKLANQKLDLLIGLRKIVLLNHALNGLNKSIVMDSENIITHLNRLMVYSYLRPTQERISIANKDIEWFESLDKAQLPPLILASYYNAYILIKLHSTSGQEEKNKINQYRNAFKSLLTENSDIVKYFVPTKIIERTE